MRSSSKWSRVALALICCAGAALAPRRAQALVPSFREIAKPCHTDCTRYGNCNAETGQCECRFGFTGPSCQQPLLPACHSSPPTDPNGSVPLYGGDYPKNCHCLKQLQRTSCTDPNIWHNRFKCTQQVFWGWKDVICYEYSGLPEEQQLSNPPEPGQPGVVWKRGVWLAVLEGGDPFGLEPLPGGASPDWAARGALVHPLAACPERCHERGHCVSQPPAAAPACVCSAFHSGPSCSETSLERCPLGCSGRGSCHGGFCHCAPGWWSYGCSRSRAFESDEWSPTVSELKIYVYDVPESLVYMRPYNDKWPEHFPIYLAEDAFFWRLLADWAVRTENPWEANLFYIPTYTYYFIGNVGFPGQHFASVIHWVRESFPFWNFTNGRNHVMASTNDRGCCDLYRLANELQRPIKMVHFAQAGRGLPRGLHRRAAAAAAAAAGMTSAAGAGAAFDPTAGVQGSSWLPQLQQLPDGQPLPHHVREQLDDPVMQAALLEYHQLAAAAAAPATPPAAPGAASYSSSAQQGPHRTRFRGFPAFQLEALKQEREPCYRPEHDVAFPNYLSDEGHGAWLQYLKLAYVYDNATDGSISSISTDGSSKDIPSQQRHHPPRFNHTRERDILFHFDGYAKEDMSYSSGVRQGLLALFGNTTRPDVLINKGGGPSTMLRSRFCFTPMGYGWGVRLTQAAATGCVPVLTHDHVWPALWDVLPYERFSLRLPRGQLHRLLDLLGAVSPEQLASLQRGLAEVHRAFIWQPEAGGLAYNYTLSSLHRRLVNLWTAFFK